MKKGLALFFAVIIGAFFIAMISVSAEDTGYGQFGDLYFGISTGDEATFDEASWDEASPDMFLFTSAYRKYYDNSIYEHINKNSTDMSGSGADGEDLTFGYICGGVMMISATVFIFSKKKA